MRIDARKPTFKLVSATALLLSLAFIQTAHPVKADLNVSLNPALYVTTELSDVTVRSDSETFHANVDVIDESVEADIHVSYVELRPAASWLLGIHYTLFGCACFAAALGHWYLGYLADFAFVRFRGVSALENTLCRQSVKAAPFCIECGEQISDAVGFDAKCVSCARKRGFFGADEKH